MNKLWLTRILLFISGIILGLVFCLIFNFITTKHMIKTRVNYIYSTSPVRVIQDDLIYDYHKDDQSLTLYKIESDKSFIKVDNSVQLINGVHNSVTSKPLSVTKINESFKSDNLQKIFIDSFIDYNLDNLLNSNKKLNKVIVKEFKESNSKNVVYSLPKNLVIDNSYEKVFNLTTCDYTYLYPNVIYSLNKNDDSSDYIFFDDYDNEQISFRYYLNDSSFKGWYLDSECNICYNYDKVVNKKIYINSNGEEIYEYHPLILYAGWY